MAIWPFGRKRTRPVVPRVALDRAQPDSSVESPTRRRSRRQRRKLSKEVEVGRDGKHREAHPSRMAPSTIRAPVGVARAGSRSVPDLPRTRDKVMHHEGHHLEFARDARDDIPSYYFLNPMSTTSLASDRPRGWGQRPPTLHAKRRANESMVRRRSSKKNKHDHVREQEVKSMSKPTTDLGLDRLLAQSGEPMKKSSSHGGPVDDLRRNFTQRNRSSPQVRRPERPTSEISDPDVRPTSSSGHDAAARLAYKIRSLDVLAPRPTIRHSHPPRELGGSSELMPSRANSKRRHHPHQPPPIPEEGINERKRVMELADDLDASGIRQLMERDQRRRERKRKVDEARVQQRLGRRAEKERREEAERALQAARAESTAELKDPVLFRPDVGGLDMDEPAKEPALEPHPGQLVYVAQEPVDEVKEEPPPGDQRDDANQSPLSWLHDPSTERLPQESPKDEVVAERAVAAALEVPRPSDDHEEPVVATAQVVRLSQVSSSPSLPASPKAMVRPTSNISQVTDTAFQESGAGASTTELSEGERRASSSVRGSPAAGWMSFFRRSGTAKTKRDSNDRGRRTPSEFSNTSRESFPRQQGLPASVRSSFQRRSGTPVRTTSKFREELPELPLSPPDSRLQSPEPVRTHAVPPVTSSPGVVVPPEANATTTTNRRTREDLPVQRHRSIEAPSIEGKATSAALSQSMASIDSEGSWLSGKPTKRMSQTQPFLLRHSTSSIQPELPSDSGDELGVVEDEYFSRLTPGLDYDGEHPRRKRKPSSTAIASSESEGEQQPQHRSRREREHGTWHGGVGRHPTVVHHTARMRSREGLLNDYLADGGEGGHEQEGGRMMSGEEAVMEEEESPLSETGRSLDDDKEVNTSHIDLETVRTRHLRHISAGSARLLEIAPRSPTEQLQRQSSVSTRGGL